MLRIELDEKLNSAKQKTKTWCWFNDSTDESLAILEEDLIQLSTDEFKQKYPFSKQAARDWLGLSASKSVTNVDFVLYQHFSRSISPANNLCSDPYRADNAWVLGRTL